MEAVDIDFYDVRVEVSQLPQWAIVWQLGPKRRVREAVSLDGKLVVASEPSLILIPIEHKEGLLAALREVDCLVAPGFTADCLAARGVHICVLKLMDALHSIGIEHVRVLGYGQRQPRRPFLHILPIAPYMRRTSFQVVPGASVDIFASGNSYDISLTIETPGVVHILDAAALRLTEFVSTPELVAQQQSDPGSVLHAVKYLKLTVFPMFSDLGKEEEGSRPAFGSMRIEPAYDKHLSRQRPTSVSTPATLLPSPLLILSCGTLFQHMDYRWGFSRLYASGIVHWVKCFLNCEWQSLPRTCATVRRQLEKIIPGLLALLKQNTTQLCSFCLEHRIITHSPIDQVVLDMHGQGMFSVAGLSHLLAGYLDKRGIRLRVLPISRVVQNLEELLRAAEELNIVASISRSSRDRPPYPVAAAWAEIINATGLSHPRWAWLLGRSDTWVRRMRTDEDATNKWAEGLQEMVDSCEPEYLEFARTVAWGTHPANRQLLVVRQAGRVGKPPSLVGKGQKTFALAIRAAMQKFRGTSLWRKHFHLSGPGSGPSLFDKTCEAVQIRLPKPSAFVFTIFRRRAGVAGVDLAPEEEVPSGSHPDISLDLHNMIEEARMIYGKK